MAALTPRERLAMVSGFGFGWAAGAAGMYFLVKNQMKTKYNKIADAEIEQVKAHYREKEMELIRLQEDIARQPKPNLDAMMEDLGYKPVGETTIGKIVAEEEEAREVDGEVLEVEIVDSAWDYRDVWNYDAEMRGRSREVPFILHKDEFDAEETNAQITVTYFEGDDVLVDEKDEVITKKDEVVGMNNLNQFGHGSGDPNVVYVRNAHIGVDYEILRHKGHYATEILGIEEESLEHSEMPKRRLRFDDDG